MEPTNQENITNAPSSEIPSQTPSQPEKPSFNKRIVTLASIVIIALIIIAGIIGYIFKNSLFGNAEQENPTTTVVNLATSTPTPADNLPKPTLYRNEQFNYELEYPASWKIIEATSGIGIESWWRNDILSDGELQKVTFMEQEDENLPASFQIKVVENINDDNMEAWIEDNTPTTVSGASLISDMFDITLNNEEAKSLSIYRFDHTETNIVVKKNNYIYVLKFTESNPNDPDMEEEKNFYEQMVSSFRFIESSPLQP